MPAEVEARRYRFDPADTSGVFLGLNLAQCALLGGGLAGGIVAITQHLPLPLAALPVTAGAGLSFVRVGGSPAWEWLGLAGGWAAMRLRRGRRWLAPLPLFPDTDGRATPLPPCLSGLSIVNIAGRGRHGLGAVRDTHRHTLTAAIRVSGGPFLVASAAEQERLLAGWGDLLTQFAGERNAAAHLSWSDLAAPSGLDAHRAWLTQQDPGDDDLSQAAASYHDLLADAASVATAHDVIVTITVARQRHPTHPDHDDADRQLTRRLLAAVDTLGRAAAAAGLTTSGALSPAELQRVLRIRVDPTAARPHVVGGRLVERLGLVDHTNAGPMGLEVAWRHVRVDSAHHRTYHVAAWPRLPVGPAWLEPFLSGAPGVTRTMTVTYVPSSAHQARRRIERDLIKLDSDAASREDRGRRVGAPHRRAAQALLDREAELVAGFSEMAYVALVSVCAPTEDDLDAQCATVEQLARECGMELRSLVGRQDLAWAAALPLGLAPRTLLA